MPHFIVTERTSVEAENANEAIHKVASEMEGEVEEVTAETESEWLAQRDLRQCDHCHQVTDAGAHPDWPNGMCEDCDGRVALPTQLVEQFHAGVRGQADIDVLYVQTTLATANDAFDVLDRIHEHVIAWSPLNEPTDEHDEPLGGVGISITITNHPRTRSIVEDELARIPDRYVTDWHYA